MSLLDVAADRRELKTGAFTFIVVAEQAAIGACAEPRFACVPAAQRTLSQLQRNSTSPLHPRCCSAAAPAHPLALSLLQRNRLLSSLRLIELSGLGDRKQRKRVTTY
eukprot:3780059-Amphidinium_carterae.1